VRASRPVSYLLALIMAAVLLAFFRSALAQERQILLPLTFNEMPKEEVPVVLQGDDVFMSVADLERAGVTGPMWHRLVAFARLVSGARKEVDGVEFISLKSLAPFLTFKFDETSLALSVTSAPQLLPATRLNVEIGPPPGIVYSKDPSTFLNYSLTSEAGHRPSLFAETGTSISGNLLLNSVSRSAEGDFVRLLSNYTFDDRQRLRRWTLGDANTTTDLLGGSALIGGVTIARNFNLDPYFIRFPPLNLRATALTPSRVEVYVNGALVSQQQVPPGQFELRNIPVSSGAGDARIVVRDVFGREQVVREPFYYSTAILAPGLSEYLYSAGFVRRGFGVKGFDYHDPALLAFHRLGVTENLTAGARLEVSRGLWSGGPGVSYRTPLGDVSLSLGASSDRGRSGGAGQLGYQYLSQQLVSFGGFVRKFTSGYANLSMSRESDRPLLDASVFIAVRASRGSISLLWTSIDPRDQAGSDRLTLSTNIPLARRTSLFASLGSANEGHSRKTEAFAGLSFFFGSATGGSLSVDHRNAQTQTAVEVDRALPVGSGFGYRLQSTAAGTQRNGSAQVQYQTKFGRYEVQLDPFHAHQAPTMTASGGLVYQGGALLPARPLQDGFAVIRVPGVENVRVYSSNELAGRTNAAGDLLVPSLLSYYGNRLSIDDRDIPLNYEVRGVELTVAPPYRGGALVEFPIRQIRTVTGSVVIRTPRGEVLPAFGQLTVVAGGDAYVSPLGRGGEFYLENLADGTYAATIDYRDGTCAFQLHIPKDGQSVIKLGHLVCSNEAVKP
jgi:outer membrane usher protein